MTLSSQLQEFVRKTKQTVENDYQKANVISHTTAKANAPRRTHRLANSLLRYRSGGIFRVFTLVPYAKFQEYGTRYFRGRFYLRSGRDAAINYLRSRGYK